MARIRTIKPEFWQNEALANVSLHAKLLAIALLNHADDGGYFLGNAALVRAACFPFDDNSKSVLGSLQELSRIGYIEIRQCDGKPIGRVNKFSEHQRIDKPQKSKLACVFVQFPNENGNSKNIPRTFQEHSKNDQRLEQGTGNREQGNGTGNGTVISSEPAVANSKLVLNPEDCKFPVFPTSGNPRTWEATETMLTEWQAAYPAVDIADHHRRAHAWIMANIGNRKTAGGMAKFLNAWFAKQQDSAKLNGHRYGKQRINLDEFVIK